MTTTEFYFAIFGGIVFVFFVVISVWGIVCLVQRKKHESRAKQRSSSVTEVNFNMNNFQKTYQVPMSSRGAKEWKPAPVVTYQNEAPVEEYYSVLPKRNNGCPPVYTPAPSTSMPVGNLNNPSNVTDGIYMKVMADPPPYHAHTSHTSRKSYVSPYNRASTAVDHYSEYELAENVRPDYGRVC